MRTSLRTWAVRAVYAAVALHLLVGMLLPLLVNLPMLDDYHRAIVAGVWGSQPAPAPALALQRWWMALFGPTVQAAAVWMGALAYIGNRQRLPVAWGALIAGLLLWAPQDMWLSLRAGAWSHVWLDSVALAGMLPPLVYLFFNDGKSC